MSGKYAADTSVSSESSRTEIERTLQRYGASDGVTNPVEERCRACDGEACDEGCGECWETPGVAGPDAHRQCRTCHGSGKAEKEASSD